jgi:hypothetical protein
MFMLLVLLFVNTYEEILIEGLGVVNSQGLNDEDVKKKIDKHLSDIGGEEKFVLSNMFSVKNEDGEVVGYYEIVTINSHK